MNGATCMATDERDGKLVAALQGALQAMMLTHGCTITMIVVSGSLNFERQMFELSEALMLLAVEPAEPLSPFATARLVD